MVFTNQRFRMRARAIVGTVVALVAVGQEAAPPRAGEPPPGSLLADPARALPRSLSEVGLFVGAPGGGQVIDRAVVYQPAWPLWSSGSTKERAIVLPIGTRIDDAGEPWEFPIGTVLFKTFSFSRPVETRLLRRGPNGWDYAVYVWEADGRDAVLADIELPIPVQVEGPDGGAFQYRVPAEIECRACHEAGESVVLGFSEVQLGPTVHALAERGLLERRSRATPAAIEHPDPLTEQVLGYLHGNCVHCHNGGARPGSAFDLRADVAVEALVRRRTESSASVAGVRVVPGRPEQSVLYQAVSQSTRNPELKPMPPLGVDVVDMKFVQLLRRWITELD